MTLAYIGLGSNLDNPPLQLAHALQALSQLPNTRLVATSALYQSAPVGPQHQPDYFNAAVALDTELAPLMLLDHLQAIETAQGRVRKEHWGARTVDLDILLFGSEIINNPRLTVPHPYLTQRSFVLYPLADIAPHLQLPDGQWLQDLVTLCPPEGIKRLMEPLRMRE